MPVNIHFVQCSERQFPKAVLGFLAVGDKLVPYRGPPSLKTMHGALHDFKISVERSSFLAALKAERKPDPLKKLRRRFYNPKSSWHPEQHKIVPTVHTYVEKVSAEIWSKFVELKDSTSSRRPILSNITFAHRWAMSWLENHSKQFIDAPTDKNLGTAILPAALYDAFLCEALEKSYSRISLEMAGDIADQAVLRIREQVSLGAGHKLFCEKVSAFLLCLTAADSYRQPGGRLLIKVHKKVPSHRLVTVGTRWVTNPLAVFVSAYLQQIVDESVSVAKDTANVVDELERIEHQLSERHRIDSFDVEKLYPSLDQEKVLQSVRLVLVSFFSRRRVPLWGLLVEIICEFVNIILSSQVIVATFIVEGKREVFKQDIGITTGLACGTQLANVHLQALDLFVKSSLAGILFFKRFVDDALVIHEYESVDMVLQQFNMWQEGIVVTHEDDEAYNHTTFLDLDIVISAGSIVYKTHRKNTNTYQYLPATSNHSSSTFKAIIHTELFRLLRTNKFINDYEWQVRFFRSKFLARGHSVKTFDQIALKYSFACKAQILSGAKKAEVVQCIVPFKICYFQGLRSLGIGSILRKHSELLGQDLQAMLNPVLCNTSSQNLFRLRYARFR